MSIVQVRVDRDDPSSNEVIGFYSTDLELPHFAKALLADIHPPWYDVFG